MSLKRILLGSAAVLVLATSAIHGAIAADRTVADFAMIGDTEAVRALLAQHADVDARQADGATALHWAVYRDDSAFAKVLIEAGANVHAATRDGATPLSLAATAGNPEILAILLGAGADPNEKLPFGKTALMLAARNGNPAAVTMLLDHGADVNAKEDLRGTTPLMWAADEAHPGAVKALVDHGADVKARSAGAPRGRGPALGKAGDPRKEQAARAAADQARAAAGGQGQAAAGQTPFDREGPADGGQLTALVYAARTNDLESVKILLAAGADVNQTTGYGWSPLLVATQNRHYKLAAYLLDHGADPDLANNGGWTPLYLATDNRNIENGDYPVRKADLEHLDFIKLLLDKGTDVNARVKDSTETRTVFTNQWLDERGATAFLRASQSSDLALMKLLLAHGADPKIATELNVTALQVAAGIGWVEGVTTEWSEAANVEAVKLLLDLGVDPNVQADTGRTALHGAGHKGRPAVIQMLVDAGARLDTRDYGMVGNDAGGRLKAHTWQPVDYADGLVRVGVQSAIAHPEAGLLFRKLMTERGLEAPLMGRTLESVCIVSELCDDVQ
ncbi:MAG TPA: ankyrin repeat domain-containing protein [Vicinamibacterales bacterium]|nr:ankyrin repeat domain-containing protein [Vicinamibacterales bacterium]